jgi:hypothetical protein
MKNYTKILLFVSIIAIAVAISFYIGRFLGEKEYFTNKRNKQDSYHRNMANNSKLKIKPNNVNLFKNMTEKEASANGLNNDTFKVIQDIYKNNKGPEDMIDIFKNNPEQANALRNFIQKNM